MKICEGCVKQDVCKFKENVEKFEKGRIAAPEPLVPDMTCKFKKFEQIVGANLTFAYPDRVLSDEGYPFLKSPWECGYSNISWE